MLSLRLIIACFQNSQSIYQDYRTVSSESEIRKQMEITHLKHEKDHIQKNERGQASNYQKTEKFIPPTHPAYVVTSSFTLPHIFTLQQEFDKHYIAMSMQTSKKKLARIPDTPNDKFFIVADDSGGPPILQGQFLSLSKKVVNYPISNNLEQVIKEFSVYIGLGHLQINEKKAESRYNINQERQIQNLEIGRLTIENANLRNNQAAFTRNNNNAPNLSSFVASASQMHLTQDNFDRSLLVKEARAASTLSKSKITFKQIVSRQEELRISQGKLFIYDNRKDTSTYKSLVSQIRARYSASKQIVIVNRIDEYNYYCLQTKEKDHILLMSQYSYVNLSEYFGNYRSIAIFDDGTQKMSYYRSKKIVLFSSDKNSIFRFVEMFGRKKEEAKRDKRKKLTQQLKAFSNKNIEREKDKKDFQRQKELKKQVPKIKAQQNFSLSPALYNEIKEQPKESSNKQLSPFFSPQKSKILNANCSKVKMQPEVDDKALIQPTITPTYQKQAGEKPTEMGYLILDTFENNAQQTQGKSKIKLVKVTDLDPNKLKQKKVQLSPKAIRQKYKKQEQPTINSPKINPTTVLRQVTTPSPPQSPYIPSAYSPPQIKQDLNSRSLHNNMQNRSLSIPSSSKIKRLKSAKRMNVNPSSDAFKGNGERNKTQPEQNYDQPSVKTHLRTGSDHHQQSHQAAAERRGSFEGVSRIKLHVPSIAGSQSKSEIDNYFIVPKKEAGVKTNKRSSLGKQAMQNAQEARGQTTLTQIVQNINQVSQSSIAQGNVNSKEQLKSHQFSPHQTSFNPSLHSYRPLQPIKKSQSEDEEDNVQIIKASPKNQKETQRQALKNKVKSAQERFENEIALTLKPKAKFEGYSNPKRIKKDVNIPPQTKDVNSSADDNQCLRLTPNFSKAIEENINGNIKNENCKNQLSELRSENEQGQRSNLFGQSEPSSIKNSNPIIVVNSPKKPCQQVHKYSFGTIRQREGEASNKKEEQSLLMLPHRQKDEHIPKLPGKKEDILKQRDNQIPLKVRKLTDEQKNQQLVNKIFKIAMNKQKQKPKTANKIVQEDPYGLPIPKAYKKENKSSKLERKQNEKTRKNQEKVGKIYRKLQTKPDSLNLRDKKSQELKADNRQFAQKIGNLNRIRSSYLPHHSAAYSNNNSKERQSSPSNNHAYSKSGQKLTPKQAAPKYGSNSSEGYPLSPYRKRSISDLIDLSKYEKCVQNGVTIYRAKQPIVTTYYHSKLAPSHLPIYSGQGDSAYCFKTKKLDICNSLNSNFSRDQPKSTESGSGILGVQTRLDKPFEREASPQFPDNKFKTSAVNHNYRPESLYHVMNDQIKEITEKICRNILAKNRGSQQNNSKKPDNFGQRTEKEGLSPKQKTCKPLLHSSSANEVNSSSNIRNNKQRTKKNKLMAEPVLQKRQQKKSQRQITQLRRQLRSFKSQLPKISEKRIESFYSSCSQSSSSDNNQTMCDSMVLYLIDKNKEIDYPQIQLLKNDKDSLIYFKDQKQLAQQLIKSEHIYDLVYIMTPNNSSFIQRIVKQYPNSYLVDFTSEPTKIAKSYISVPDIHELQAITPSLITKARSKIKEYRHQRKYPATPRCRPHAQHNNRKNPKKYEHIKTKLSAKQQSKSIVHHHCQARSANYCNICGNAF